jgi:UPF0755 protein
VTIVVPKGASASQIASMLAKDHVISNAWLFRVMAHFDGRDADLQPGIYHLRTNMSYKAVLDALAAGPVIKLERFTIPEGFTISEIVDVVRKKTSLSAAKFQAEIGSGKYRLPIMPAGSKNLEGLLFPKTYDVREGSTEGQLVQAMLNQFTEETTGLNMKAIKGITPYQIVIVASMIEREAKVPQDRAKIAGVIYNRLARHMKLEIDATVEYSILQKTGSYKFPLTYADYNIASPYNTYQIPALPPAPIASPGLASIQAALNPAKFNALYYVVCDPSGAHAFADTADQFQKLQASCRSKQQH